ncbi:flavodoxin [Alloscardovia theropitheci]|uniref:Flavodoxin n=1 Tax=Alloscardovia theropitheci TaxID=2496842 RepID=A0A4R0QRF4_9BIFI|nr:flavodoxin [Alloscardovia theropitheci]TCD53615.1 flavodoxin [Alloscardovia theropitheci]
MKKRITIFTIVLALIVVAAGIFMYTRSQARNQATQENSAAVSQAKTTRQSTKDLSGDHDVLVVYFSRTQGVWNGPLEIGNTARIANFIQEATNADTFEILPQNDYPDDYTQTTRIARDEQNNNARPAIKGDLPDLSGYEYIFIGAPVWWGEYPMIVRTFLDAEANGLSNKTLIPFTTNEGSGLGNTQSQLSSQFPQATVLDGFSVRGPEAANSQADVDSWLKQIGVTQ